MAVTITSTVKQTGNRNRNKAIQYLLAIITVYLEKHGMPQSKKRPGTHHQQQHTPGNNPQRSNHKRLEIAGMIFFSIIGLLISYFIAGANIYWLIAGAAIGVVTGYFFTRQMRKALLKK